MGHSEENCMKRKSKKPASTIPAKTYCRMVLAFTGLLLVCFGLVTIIVDPLFHYHKPLQSLQYPLWDERYMDDGIIRHFDYDAVITGTSMSENFRASQFDNLYGTTSVKVPLSGGSYREVNDLLERAFRSHSGKSGDGGTIRYVVRSMDQAYLIRDKDSRDYEDYPEYLYNDNPFDDVKYFWNQDIFTTFTQYVFTFNRLGGNSTDFDTYANWSGTYPCDGEKVRNEHIQERSESGISGNQVEQPHLTDEERQMVLDNLNQNVIRIAKEHPETEFLLFVPPYSICWWDNEKLGGRLERDLEAFEIMADELTGCDNIHLYAYADYTNITMNLGLYMDNVHYGQDVSNLLLDCMKQQVGLITRENEKEYIAKIRDIYQNFDYDQYFSSGE